MNVLNFLRKPYIAIFLAITFLSSSCTQYQEDLKINFDKEKTHVNKHNRLLTDTEIKQIGINHNLSLKNIFASNPKNAEDVTKMALELHKEEGLKKEDLVAFQNIVHNMNTRTLADLIKGASESFVDSKLLISKLFEIKRIKNVVDLKIHENDTRTQLKGIDLDTYLITSTVYQYSIEFWSKMALSKPAVSNWQEADGITASIGFLTLAGAFAVISGVGIASGGTGIIPTITIVASLLRIGASAALASIYYVIS